ncbi:MAG: DM13 domain-containing protein [Cyanosarcina radialis HA8281-LM2]|jgi:hypothetical protein|nr:DM13 domain-containing protein [Cyanosarcina radialis HA8281-LM2]
MKLNYLSGLGLASSLLIGSVGVIAIFDRNPALADCNKRASGQIAAAQSGIATGNFVKGEHPTTGTVRIINENGKSYLEFNDSFKTNEGPDLFVILYRSSTVPVSGIQEADYVNIAKLKKVSGSQRYAIPSNVDISQFASVAIWCRQFNATFGYATLM